MKMKENKKNNKLFKEKPTKKFSKIKKASVFGSSTKSAFENYYKNNHLPCKIEHGSIQNKLVWEKDLDLDDMQYDPILFHFYQGLNENRHPYDFLCREAIKDLTLQKKAGEKIKPMLKNIVKVLRDCLSNKKPEIFVNGLLGLRCLSQALKQDLNSYLKFLIS